LKHYFKALHFGYKVIEGPFQVEEMASHQGQEIVGLLVTLVIRSLRRRRIPDSNVFYRVECGSYTGLCSLRCPSDSYQQLRWGFGELLDSFSVQQAAAVGMQ